MSQSNIKKIILKKDEEKIYIQLEVNEPERFDSAVLTFQGDRRINSTSFFGKTSRFFVDNTLAFEVEKNFFYERQSGHMFSMKVAFKKGQITTASEFLCNSNLELVGFDNLIKNDLNITFFDNRITLYRLGKVEQIINKKYLQIIQHNPGSVTTFAIISPQNELVNIEYIFSGWPTNLYNVDQRYEKGSRIYYFPEDLEVNQTDNKVMPVEKYFGFPKIPTEFYGDDVAYTSRGCFEDVEEVTFIFNGYQKKRPYVLNPLAFFDENFLVQEKKLFISVSNFSSYMSGIYSQNNGLKNLTEFVSYILNKYNLEDKQAVFFAPSITSIPAKILSKTFKQAKFILAGPANNINTSLGQVFDREFYIRSLQLDPTFEFIEEVEALYEEREVVLSLSHCDVSTFEKYKIDFPRVRNSTLYFSYLPHTKLVESTFGNAYIEHMNMQNDRSLMCDVSLINNQLNCKFNKNILVEFAGSLGISDANANIVLDFKESNNKIYLQFDENIIDWDLSFIKTEEKFDVSIVIVSRNQRKAKKNIIATDMSLKVNEKEYIAGEYFSAIDASYNNGIFNIRLEDVSEYSPEPELTKYYVQIHGKVKVYTIDLMKQWESDKWLIPKERLEVINDKIGKIIIFKELGNVIKYQEFEDFDALEKNLTKYIT